ncbi:ICE-like protease (caspase) p20 domain protein [Ceratobasidium sp. AG-Ba]|nr:ICE-like protease (caspase) p20 domain protein [Ceratobasidium sp. AG-Ba]
MGKATVVQNAQRSPPAGISEAGEVAGGGQGQVLRSSGLARPTPVTSFAASPQSLGLVPRISEAATPPNPDHNVTFCDLAEQPTDELSTAASHSPKDSAHAVRSAIAIEHREAFRDTPVAQEVWVLATPNEQTLRNPKFENSGGAVVNNKLARGTRGHVAASPLSIAATNSSHITLPRAPQTKGPSPLLRLPLQLSRSLLPSSNPVRRRYLLESTSPSQSGHSPTPPETQSSLVKTWLASVDFKTRILCFSWTKGRPTSASSHCVGVGCKRGRTAKSSHCLAPNEPQWQGTVYIDGERRFVHPTRKNIIEGFRYLVKDAKEGDYLVWQFAGHCVYVKDQGPYLVTAGTNFEQPKVEDMISREDIRDELIMRVPRGCRLDIFFEGCYSSAFFNLQYCVGCMHGGEYFTETQASISTTGPLPRHVTAKLGQFQTQNAISANAVISASISKNGHGNVHATLCGSQPHMQTAQIAGPVEGGPEPTYVSVLQARNTMFTPNSQSAFSPVESLTSLASSTPKAPKRSSGIATAPGPRLPTTVTQMAQSRIPGLSTLIKSVTGAAPDEFVDELAEARQFTSPQARHARQSVIGAHSLDFFGDRKGKFDKPEGHVTTWLAAGAHQQAFEASKPAKHGIVMNSNASSSQVLVSQPSKIGINSTRLGDEKRLRYAAEDAKRFKRCLTDKLNFKNENVRVLTDDEGTSGVVSCEMIVRGLEWLWRCDGGRYASAVHFWSLCI